MNKQKTIAGKITFQGPGLHTGQEAKIELLPAGENTGIICICQDKQATIIKASLDYLIEPNRFPRRTSIGFNNSYIHTVEHLMAALNLLNIDNLQVNIWGEEIPGLDGSAKPFVDKINEVGCLEQKAERNYTTIKDFLYVEEGDCSIVALPAEELKISYSLKYDNDLIGSRFMETVINGQINNDTYVARTFCLEEEVKPLLDMGLGKGANYENTLVVSREEIKNNKLRVPDEFIKHKVLDLIGDLYLIGPLKAHIIAIKSGHSLNIKLIKKIMQSKKQTKRGWVGSQISFVPQKKELDIGEIMRLLPHRYPFLLVDRIIELEQGKRIVGIKNVSMNEHFFQGHFPERPVMPGVLILEAMAQVGGVLLLACEEHKGKLAYFMSANKVKFRKTVEPGDQLVFEVFVGRVKSKTGIVYGKAYVDGKIAAEAELMCALVDS